MTQRSESGMKMWYNTCFWYFVGKVILQIVKFVKLWKAN